MAKEIEIDDRLVHDDDGPPADIKTLLSKDIAKKLLDPGQRQLVVDALFRGVTADGKANAAEIKNFLSYVLGDPKDFSREMKTQILVKQKVYRIDGPILCPHCHKCVIDKPDKPDKNPEEKQRGAVH